MNEEYKTLSLKGGISQERAKNVFDRVTSNGRSILGTNDNSAVRTWILSICEELEPIFEQSNEYIKIVTEILNINSRSTGFGSGTFSTNLYRSSSSLNINSTDDTINRILDIITDMQAKVLKIKNVLTLPVSETNIALAEKITKTDKNKIFIVHGHDNEMKLDVARFVDKLGLESIILHEQASQGKTIIEKFEKHSDVEYAIILLSPDDVGNVNSLKENLNLRARQNVVLELGFFMGKLGREKVCAIMKDNIEKPSDIDGVVYVQYSGSWQYEVAKEIKAAGISVDMNKVL